MNRDLHLTNTQFGTAAGCFAVGYAVAGIPSTLLLHRFGARRWISLTMLIWGLCSAATAFVTRPEELFGVRALLGMAEAGLAPGVVLYTGSLRRYPQQWRLQRCHCGVFGPTGSATVDGLWRQAVARSLAVCSEPRCFSHLHGRLRLSASLSRRSSAACQHSGRCQRRF
jgi:hypothetical protein